MNRIGAPGAGHVLPDSDVASATLRRWVGSDQVSFLR
jgi:hypothetical protein